MKSNQINFKIVRKEHVHMRLYPNCALTFPPLCIFAVTFRRDETEIILAVPRTTFKIQY
jgi:hypothetical protein